MRLLAALLVLTSLTACTDPLGGQYRYRSGRRVPVALALGPHRRRTPFHIRLKSMPHRALLALLAVLALAACGVDGAPQPPTGLSVTGSTTFGLARDGG